MNLPAPVTDLSKPRPRPEPWMQSLYGKRVDLLNPKVEQVNFREIADTMAHINRYNGASGLPVSVAQHTLHGLDFARQANHTPQLCAMWLLHDAHETRIGDVISPVSEMRAALTEEMHGPAERERERQMWQEAKRRHDAVIYFAAGLPLPSAAQAEIIHDIDMTMLATEKRDFLAPCAEPWGIDLQRILPARGRLKIIPAPEAAQRLDRAFKTYLPALAWGARR